MMTEMDFFLQVLQEWYKEGQTIKEGSCADIVDMNPPIRIMALIAIVREAKRRYNDSKKLKP